MVTFSRILSIISDFFTVISLADEAAHRTIVAHVQTLCQPFVADAGLGFDHRRQGNFAGISLAGLGQPSHGIHQSPFVQPQHHHLFRFPFAVSFDRSSRMTAFSHHELGTLLYQS
jgi:hypothetical protein